MHSFAFYSKKEERSMPRSSGHHINKGFQIMRSGKVPSADLIGIISGPVVSAVHVYAHTVMGFRQFQRVFIIVAGRVANHIWFFSRQTQQCQLGLRQFPFLLFRRLLSQIGMGDRVALDGHQIGS